VQTLETLLPAATIIGTSANAAIYGGKFCADRAVVVFLPLARAKLTAFAIDDATVSNAELVALEIAGKKAKNALIFCAHSACEVKPFLRALGKKIETIVCLSSASAAIVCGQTRKNSGAAIVVFDGDELFFEAKRCVEPFALGKETTITKTAENRVVELDHTPIAEVSRSYLGDDAPKNAFVYLKKSDGLPAFRIDGEIIAPCAEGDRARLGVLPNAAFEYGGGDRFGEAIWQFTSKPPICFQGAGCYTDNVFFAQNGLLEQNNEILLRVEERKAQDGDREDDREKPLAGRKNAIMRLLRRLSEDSAEQTRAEKQEETPQNAAQPRTDRLTNLPGRGSFMERLSAVKNPSVALFNIERFSDVNALYGFSMGDQLLKELSDLVVKSLEKDTSLFRIGGDLFVLLADGYDDERFLRKVESIEALVSSTIFLDDTLAASNARLQAGVAFGTSRVLSRAEAALRRARNKRIPIAVAGMDDEKKTAENLKTLSVVRQAALQPWWTLAYYQPIARAKDGAIVKYEALMRLRDSNGRIRQPAEFLELAKRSRYYPELTKNIFAAALKTFKSRKESAAINLAPEDMQNGETMSAIATMIADFGEPERLTIEITESEMIEDYKAAIAAIDELKKLGVKIAIDDFGSGYSNFAYLVKFQADYVKIDGSITSEIVKSEKAFQTFSAIVDFAKRLGIETIAEFIASEAIAKKATEAGADYLQGYFIGSPAPL
jgi:diguanylate cyclase (GGDEF)-like protein